MSSGIPRQTTRVVNPQWFSASQPWSVFSLYELLKARRPDPRYSKASSRMDSSLEKEGPMATERDSVLPRALSNVLSDLANLIQTELRLARAELSSKLSIKLRAGIWMATAAGLSLVAVLLLAQALVLWIAATFAIPLHLSCLIVGLCVSAAAGMAYYQGWDDAEEELTPSRTLHQIEQDVTNIKEQLR